MHISLLSPAASEQLPNVPAARKHVPISSRLSALLFLLLPSFVQRRLRPAAFRPRSLHPTSWLDGLRGVAAYIVFLYHMTEFSFNYYHSPYGIQDDLVPSSPLQLPFVRVIFSGRPMVHIFFIVSGFALSYKPLKCIRSRDYEGLHRAISSSLFRRGIRLYFPVIGVSFILMVFVRLGWTPEPTRLPTLTEQFLDWLTAMWVVSLPWHWDVFQWLPYNIHFWTIPVEYGCSLLLYVTLIALSRLRTYLRFVFLLGIMTYCIKSNHWGPVEFLAGMGMAEINHIQDARQGSTTVLPSNADLSVESKRSSISISSLVVKLFLAGNFLFGLFVVGWPTKHVEATPGISRLLPYTIRPYLGTAEAYNFWFCLGSIQIVAAVHQIKFLQKLFLTPLAQYLGDVSFSVYLIHGPVLKILNRLWMPLIWALVGGIGQAQMLGRMFAWFCSVTVMTIQVFWAGDLVWRLIDVKNVEFARWFETLCTKG